MSQEQADQAQAMRLPVVKAVVKVKLVKLNQLIIPGIYDVIDGFKAKGTKQHIPRY